MCECCQSVYRYSDQVALSACNLQIDKSHSLSDHQNQPMKQLLETIWNFVRKIPRGITKYMRDQRTPRDNQVVVEKWEICQERKGRQKRKRKSFKSFVDEEEEQSKAIRKRPSKLKLKRRTPSTLNEPSISSNLIGQNQDSSVKATPRNDLIRMSRSVECDEIFQDLNGVEISMINQGRNNEQLQFKESDSEVELIKLISGDNADGSERMLARQFQEIRFEDVFRRKDKLEWWQMIVEGRRFTSTKKSREYLQPPSESEASHLAQSLSNIQISNHSLNNPPKPNRNYQSRSSRIKVVNLIDLTLDEDFPRLYQIPLAVKVYD